MEMTIVSAKVMKVSLLGSFIALLLIALYQSIYSHSFIFVCNNNSVIEGYVNINSKNYVFNSIYDKNSLGCLGKKMAFYDRSIAYYLTPVAPQGEDPILKRYSINNFGKPSFMPVANNNAIVYLSNRNILVIRKKLNLLELTRLLNQYKPSTIIIPEELKNNLVDGSLHSLNIAIIYVGTGKDKSIQL